MPIPSAAITNFNPRAPYGARQNPAFTPCWMTNFNPRAPYGARRKRVSPLITLLEFQSTRPVRGATGVVGKRLGLERNFNPRAPYGARQSG